MDVNIQLINMPFFYRKDEVQVDPVTKFFPNFVHCNHLRRSIEKEEEPVLDL